jgi:hypothetical protein
MRLRILIASSLVLATIAGLVWLFWERIEPSRRKEAEAREKLAFESVVGRMPKGKPISLPKPQDAKTQAYWQEMDVLFGNGMRTNLLKELHERTHRFFVKSPGQGPSRAVWSDEDFLLNEFPRKDTPQPGPPADFPLSPGEKLEQTKSNDDFRGLHRVNLFGFLYPDGFGYVKDRDHVAGFESHGFRWSQTPEKSRWRVDHIQLVGILTQAQPIVYLTDKMPSMDQIRHGKTRGLDFFEEVALPKLCEGEDLYIVQKNDTIRMLGAIRATKTCQKCHDAEIGDLLGAFSYTLRPALKAANEDD